MAEATPTRFYLDNGTLTRTPPETPSTDPLHYTPRGTPSGRSWEQWSLGAVSFALGHTGRRIPYDRDNRRMQHKGVLTYTSDPLPTPTLIAGPVGVTLFATTTTTESLWVVHLDDVAPDGTSRPLTQGALLGSRRTLDPTRTWYTASGGVLLPHHPHRRDSTKPVTPGETTCYDIEVYPTFARLGAGHRIRITIATSDFPHLVPVPMTRPSLRSGIYQLHLGAEGSHVEIPLATPGSFTEG